MTTSNTIISHATLPADALRYALTHDHAGQPADMLSQYPALKTLDDAQMQRSAMISPDQCPNNAATVFALNELNLPIDTGNALLDAASSGIPEAIADIQNKTPARWFSLSPVYWRAERDHVTLIGLPESSIREDEMRALIESIAPWLAEWQWHIHIARTNAWFIRTETEFDYHAPDLVLAQSDQLESFLPHGADLKRWQTLLTEIQMLWFEHPVNLARTATKQHPINSLWLHSSVHSRQISTQTLEQWPSLTQHIITAPTDGSREPHAHLAWLNQQLSPAALHYQQHGHVWMTFLGSTWQQNLMLNKPTFTERLKKNIQSKNKKPLIWLEQPAFDLPINS